MYSFPDANYIKITEGYRPSAQCISKWIRSQQASSPSFCPAIPHGTIRSSCSHHWPQKQFFKQVCLCVRTYISQKCVFLFVCLYFCQVLGTADVHVCYYISVFYCLCIKYVHLLVEFIKIKSKVSKVSAFFFLVFLVLLYKRTWCMITVYNFFNCFISSPSSIFLQSYSSGFLLYNIHGKFHNCYNVWSN